MNKNIVKIMGNPHLIDYVEAFKKKIKTDPIKLLLPPLGALLDAHSEGINEVRFSKIENDLDYINKQLDLLKENDETFIHHPEFPAFVNEILNNIFQADNESKRKSFCNLLINSIEKKELVDYKLMYLKTLSNLTPLHIEVLAFYMNPMLFCGNHNCFPNKVVGSGGKEQILVEIFSDYSKEIILQATLDLQGYGILQERILVGAYQTGHLGYNPQNSTPREKDRVIQTLLSYFTNKLTMYGLNFTEYLIRKE